METDPSQRGRKSSTAAPSVDALDNSIAQSEVSTRTAPADRNGDDRAPAPAVDAGASGVSTEAVSSAADRHYAGAELMDAQDATGIIDQVQATGSQVKPARTRRLPLPKLHIDERLGRILLAVVLAALLWLYVASLDTITTRFQDLAVDVRGTADQLKVVNTIPPVSASVQAPQSTLNTLSKSDIHPYVDAAGLEEGVYELPVLADLSGNRGQDISVAFSPRRVQVQLEVQSTRFFSVTVKQIGTPAFGYRVEPWQVSPPEVKVIGPRDAVSRVESVFVQVDIDEKASTQQGYEGPVALDDNGQEVKGVTFDPPTVQVSVPIKLLLNYKVVPVQIPLEGQPAAGYRVSSIEIDPTNVTICCTPSLLDPIQSLGAAPVAITGTTSSVVATTELLLPRGVELYPGQPRQITVTVSVEALITTFKVAVAASVEGLPPGYSAIISPNQLELNLAGAYTQVQSLNLRDVRAVVNVAGREEGTYNLTPQITVPQGVLLESYSPAQVTVTLTSPTPVPTETPEPTPTPTHTPAARPSETPTSVPTHSPIASPSPTATPQATRPTETQVPAAP